MWKMSLQIFIFSVIIHFEYMCFFLLYKNVESTLNKWNTERKIETHRSLPGNTLLNLPLYFQVSLNFLVSDLQTASWLYLRIDVS